MAVNDRYGGAPKKKKGNSFLAPIIFVLVVLVLLFLFGVFFRVQNIEVIGAVTYADEEIIEASGVEIGDNLFFINRFSASSQIFSRLPFIDSAAIERSLPNTIVITVEESSAAAYVDWQEQSWMITSGGKLLGSATGDTLAGLIHVAGVTPLSPVVGESLAVEESEALKLAYLLDILSVMQADGLVSSVTELDMSNVSDPSFRYIDRFTVRLGQNTDLDYKLRMLLAAVRQMDAGETGIVDVSDGSTVYVSPE